MRSFSYRGKLTKKSARHFRRIDAYNRKVELNRISKGQNHRNRARRIHNAFGGGYVR